MRCSLECHPGCECRPDQPILALVKRDEPVTIEAMLEFLSDEDVRDVAFADGMSVQELVRRMKEARSGTE